MLTTKNYKLKKPELTDSPPDITVMNFNWDTVDEKLFEVIQAWEDFKANGGEIGGTITYPKGVTRQIEQLMNLRERDYKQRQGLSNYNGYPCWSTIIEDPTNDNNTNGLLFMLGSGEGDAYNDNYVRPLKMGYAQKNNLGSPSVPWDDIFLRGVSKSTNGHTKLPNGMIMQWGYGSLNGRTTFPIAFHSAALSVIASADNTQAVYISCKDVITTSFVTVASQNGGFRWIAIGY